MQKFLLAMLLILSSSQTLAFGAKGHKLVCDMAYQLVSTSSRQQLDVLSKKAGYTDFASACVWPDEVRSQPEFRWSAPLHFVNFARDKHQVTPADCPAQGCILSAIDAMQQRLRQDNTDWQALLFLAHFIADLHQPLHVSFADDLGGNRTAVYFYGQPNNLHGVWDFAMLKQLGYEDDAAKAGALLNQLNGEQGRQLRAQWQHKDVLAWTNESAKITIAIYHDYKPGMLIDADYVAQYQPVLEQRLLQASVRLAMLLEQLLSDNAATS